MNYLCISQKHRINLHVIILIISSTDSSNDMIRKNYNILVIIIYTNNICSFLLQIQIIMWSGKMII